ncbi:MAG: arylsulfatase [Phycisphaerae bacterium]|nr:arylsulfatase [Phycisphaerae bacterium]MDP7286351.1 arylsulfatase [Phycisphaerae bacterium]
MRETILGRRDFMSAIGIGAAAIAGARFAGAAPKGKSKPNIILIMTDDMGFSDLGCYGSEISTPNLDALASGGLKFTQFYNTGRCCPTRASLLTGLYPHQAGVGHMNRDRGPQHPGYRGRLTKRCVTIAEVLNPAGYFTFTTGKWHVGAKEKSHWPIGRGFKRSYSCPQGAGFYFSMKTAQMFRQIVRGDKVIYDKKNDMPDGWYSTDAWTDEGLKFAAEAAGQGKPFFWYLAHNAPHWPLQAKPQDIAKYRGKYKIGWDEIRKRRYAKLIKLGMIDKSWPLSPRGKGVPAWDTLSEKQKDNQDLRMATYAAMIDSVDQNVGKIVKKLKELGQYENTLIMFLQDNGGCAEGGNLGSNAGKGVCGTAGSFSKYGACWANASNTPFRRYKHWVHEGGAGTPLVAHWPEGIAAGLRGKLITEPSHLVDLMATCVDISGAEYPKTFKGAKIIPAQGKSLRPLLAGEKFDRGGAIYFEHEGNRAVRLGKWKIVSIHRGKWELYDMSADRTELNDLSAKMPDKLGEMIALYDAWSKRALVEPWGAKRRKTRK